MSVKKYVFWVSMIFLMACESGLSARKPYPKWNDVEQWSQFKQCFVTQEGRVTDNWQKGSSHSEGQGYGMLLATSVHDRETFARLWQWTQSHLQIRDDELMVWRWHAEKPHTPDLNNATDGDLLIAWALIRAAEIWRDERAYFLSQADAILTSLAKNVVRKDKYHLLLPAVYGFEHDHFYVVNFSYYVYPALFDAARLQANGPWRNLIEDGLRMQRRSLIKGGLPVDWNRIDRQSGKLLTVKKVENNDPHNFNRFGYEAIRIPLYSCWIDDCRSDFDGLKQFWRQQSNPPAWVDLVSNQQAEYPLANGGLAVRDLLLNMRVDEDHKFDQCSDQSDYYSSVLSLLSQVASIESKVFDL